jgi:hypothetical protein
VQNAPRLGRRFRPTERCCGDGIDNNCNCVVDECPNEEICDDGFDNDGDGFADADDPACYLIIR